MPKFELETIGSSLVIGGCGFVGYHVVRQILKEGLHGPITVASRDPSKNRIYGVEYITLDISNSEALITVLKRTNPQVIFHLAAPRAVDGANDTAIFHKTIVVGTQNLLKAAKSHPSVKALVYASTPAVNQGYDHFNLNENAPLWNDGSSTFPYYRAKALAEIAVLSANLKPTPEGLGILTATLRLPMVYGERDNPAIPGQLDAFQKGQTKVQLGNGSNMVEPLYAPIAAEAHLLAAKALLASQSASLEPRVDGEAFNITNGDPQPFWDFSRRIWSLVGDQTKPEEIMVVPGQLALGLATVIEWSFWIFTLGFRKPPLNISRLYIQYSIYNATYSIDKARTRLGFKPELDLEASLRSSIASALEAEPEKYKGLQLV